MEKAIFDSIDCHRSMPGLCMCRGSSSSADFVANDNRTIRKSVLNEDSISELYSIEEFDKHGGNYKSQYRGPH